MSKGNIEEMKKTPNYSSIAGKNPEIQSNVATILNENDKGFGQCTTINITLENVAILIEDSLLKNEVIKQADLILIYRDNTCYTRLNHDLEVLLKEGKYKGKVVCISIDKSIQIDTLEKSQLLILEEILEKYRCITDSTMSEWLDVAEVPKIDNIADNIHELLNGKREEQVSAFIQQSKKISKICDKKGIKTIYMVYKIADYDIFLLEHGGLCQGKDGTIYRIGGIKLSDNKKRFEEDLKGSTNQDWEAVLKGSERHKEILEDAKRYWTNIFPNQKVLFIEASDLKNLLKEVDGGSQSLLLIDRHGFRMAKYFENRVFYAGHKFEPDGGYEKFVHDNVDLGLDARNILEYLKTKMERNKN